MKILNDELSSESINRVLFFFAPVALPIKDGALVPEEEASDTHYATTIYDVDSGEFKIFEFGNRIKNAIAGYKKRHESFDKLQILMTRHDSGKIKITAGRLIEESFLLDNIPNIEELKITNSNLLDDYLSNTGYTVKDIEVI